MAPSQLVWQLVKNYNCFLHKGLNGSQFSAEPGNLYNLNSYKYSGEAYTFRKARPIGYTKGYVAIVLEDQIS